MPIDVSFPFRIVRPEARVRLFCLPYAGGAARLYREWPERLGPHVEVCPVELPGRGVRFREKPLTTMRELCALVESEIAPLLDRPVAIFGHSLGARLGFELAKELGARVVQLFVSAAPAPDAPRRSPRLAHLPAGDFKRELHAIGGTPPEVLADDELMDFLLPLLRADFSVSEGATWLSGTRVACPVTALAGKLDGDVPLDDARAWQRFTDGAFRFVEMDAGHFFLEPKRDDVLREVERDLARFEPR